MNTRCDPCEPNLFGVMPTATLLQLLRQGAAKLLGLPYLPDLAELKVLLLIVVPSALMWGGRPITRGRRTRR
ncbi:MAG: hypothetical protein IT537_15800 [Hyphomicrobiales bacterium]|nr:hypothetical protein [Hyphomicrobiales bacterium]